MGSMRLELHLWEEVAQAHFMAGKIWHKRTLLKTIDQNDIMVPLRNTGENSWLIGLWESLVTHLISQCHERSAGLCAPRKKLFLSAFG